MEYWTKPRPPGAGKGTQAIRQGHHGRLHELRERRCVAEGLAGGEHHQELVANVVEFSSGRVMRDRACPGVRVKPSALVRPEPPVAPAPALGV
jgi:hypothetical protein